MAKNGSDNKKDNYGQTAKVLEQEGRVPPQAVEVEEAILGAMLIESGAAIIAFGMLVADDFYKPAHRHIFETLYNLSQRDNPLDLLTVENELRDNNLLDVCGGSAYLSDLTRSVSSAANIEYHAQIIIEKAVKRNLILNCTDVIKESYDTASDAYDVLDDAEQRIFDLANNKTKNASKPVSEILKDTLEYLEDMRGKEGGITGIPTGLSIDQMTAGWQKGDLVIIAARPSMGKTAFVLTAARNAAMHHDENLRTPVAIFSLEMSNQSLVQRLLTMEARVRADEARKGTLNDESFKQLIDAASNLHEADIFIDDTPAITLMELRTKCRRLKSEHDIGLIVIDYLQLMQGNAKDSGNREQEIASISRGLKSLAKELDVPVIALSQLSRAVEQRGGDKRPQLSDLRESGSIEQDADIVMFLYRPEYYGITTTEEGQSTAGLAEVIIGKQRNGPVGSKMHYFVKDYARFENLTTADTGGFFGATDSKPKLADSFESGDFGPPPMPHNPAPDEDAPFKFGKLIVFFSLFLGAEVAIAFQQDYARIVVNTLASDEFNGRGYVKKGEQKAAEFISKEFKRFGLNAFEKNYYQSFSTSVNTFPKQVSVSVNGNQLEVGSEFLIEPGSPSIKGTFEIVEITAKDLLSDDKLRSKLIQSQDKFLVLKPFVIKDYKKEEQDRINGVIGFLKYNPQSPQSGFIQLSESKLTWSGSTQVYSKPSLTVSTSALPNPIEQIEIDIQNEFHENYKTQNVLGYIEGEHSDSVVTLMAHYDHLGMIGNAVFNGANDNASGTAMLLSLAKYFSVSKPKYTIVFIAFGAEELGLIGSKYFVENPLYDLSTTKFFLNFDIAGTGDDGIQVVNGSVYRDTFDQLVELNKENELLPEVRIRGAACNSDHCMFDQKDIPGFYIYTRGGIQAYHDIFDRPETLPLTEFEDYYKLIIEFISDL